jgi:hypothetical protein
MMSGTGAGAGGGKEARDAENDRITNLLLQVVEDNRQERENTRRVRGQLSEVVTALESSHERANRMDRNQATTAQRITDIEGHLASFMPRIDVVMNIAKDAATKTAAATEKTATATENTHKLVEQTRAEVKEARDKTDQFVLEAAAKADPKGQATHFLDRFDNVRTRTWLFSLGGLILTIVVLTLVYFLDLGLKRQQEAPHARDHAVSGTALPTGPSGGESKPDRNPR